MIPDGLHGSNGIMVGDCPGVLVSGHKSYVGWHVNTAPAVGILTPRGEMRVVELDDGTASVFRLQFLCRRIG
jgi:hypothetical protein